VGLGSACIRFRRLYLKYSLLMNVTGRFVRMDSVRISVASCAESIASSLWKSDDAKLLFKSMDDGDAIEEVIFLSNAVSACSFSSDNTNS